MTRSLLAGLLFFAGFHQAVFAQAPDKIQGKTAAEWAETLKNHKELKFRRVALIVLEVYGPRVDPVLTSVTDALASDPEPQIRREAAMLLGRMGPDAKGAIFALGDALRKDQSEIVREAAAQALTGKLNVYAADQVTTLAEALNDSHAGTRAAAAEAILKLGDRAGPATPALIALAKDNSKDRFSRQYALKCLSRLGGNDRDIALMLIAIRREPKAPLPLREEAADGLGRSTVATDVVMPPLADGLNDPIIEVRRAVAAAIAKQGKDAGIVWPKIADGFKTTDQPTRYQLIRIAGRLAKTIPEAEAALIEQAKKDPHAENRLAAIQELGELGEDASREVTGALIDLADNDPSAAIRNAADASLKKLRN